MCSCDCRSQLQHVINFPRISLWRPKHPRIYAWPPLALGSCAGCAVTLGSACVDDGIRWRLLRSSSCRRQLQHVVGCPSIYGALRAHTCTMAAICSQKKNSVLDEAVINESIKQYIFNIFNTTIKQYNNKTIQQ